MILIDFSFFVLKGVVIYGFELEIIVFRVCKYIYGIVKIGIWKEGDFESKKFLEKIKKGFYWCDGVFDKYVEVG